jgi:hypothetical protein
MSNLGIQSLQIVKRSPGIILIMFGFMTIYLVVGFRFETEPTVVTYLTVGFGFLLTFAGIAFLFRDLAGHQKADSELSLSIGSSDIEHAVNQMGKNYDVLRRQATQGFVLAGTFMALGILVILAGSLGEMFGFTKAASNLTTIAGVIVETISGLGLYLFKETSKRLNATSDRLHEMWKVLAAFKKAETLPEDKKTEVTITLINKLVETPSYSLSNN